MHFNLIDAILEQTDDHIVVLKQVTLAEEYLQDHFPTFPVLPGVMMIETMIQAARHLLAPRTPHRLVLAEAKALKYGAMVRPGQALRMEVTLKSADADQFACRANGTVLPVPADENTGANAPPHETAVAGRFTMRPVNPSLS